MADPTTNHEQVAEAFDELIEAYELLRAADRSLEEYIANNVSPEIPELFEDVEALLRYNAEKSATSWGSAA